ncbi:MAG: hypothetical protein IK080_04295 [Clostridia bacterium]|nr:hypothetical protein [Clostridia bacterium]
MIEYFKTHPYWIAILAALTVAAVLMWIKAIKASRAHYQENEKIMKKLKEENKLRNDFAVLTPALAQSADPVALFKGVSLNLQKRVADQADLNAAFAALSPAQQGVYALYFVLDDGGEALSGFFKANTAPLTTAAGAMLETLALDDLQALFRKEALAYDPDDETTSLIPKEIEDTDAAFAAADGCGRIAAACGAYIAANPEAFQ